MWKAALLIFMTIFFTFLIVGGGYAYYMYELARDNVRQMNDAFDEELGTSPRNSSNLSGTAIFLIAGIGDRPGEASLSDVIMVVSVNPEDDSILMFNIPRDTQVSLPDRNGFDKINHSYSYGGINLLKETVETRLNVKFDYVIESNMNGFVEIVDVLGNVEVDSPFAFSQNNVENSETHHYEKGPITLDGERALHYVRMRKNDPRGDLGRNERQQQVLSALLQDARSIDTLLNGQSLLSILGENVKTNVTMTDLHSLAADYRHTADNIRTFEIPGSNAIVNGISYYEVSDEEWQKAALRLENHQSR
ncbi:LCP family protein [Alteribacillus sp. HJP-4]|uniref:LCP family protein n=1 Tax=Alteribacillus sp. HJP-4 TaxID=2775394 RepID=UPI0035CD2A6C